MRWVKNMLLVLVTLALAATGAAMPFAASRLQDARQAGTETRSFDSFVLTLEKKGELSRILRFLSENQFYDFIEAAPEDARMSEAEAVDAAKEAVILLAQYKLVSPDVMSAALDPIAAGIDEPFVIMRHIALPDDPQTLSFITWIIYWEMLDILIDLDDASGKAYQISISDETWPFNREKFDKNTASVGRSIENMYAQSGNWGMFLEEYYEVKFRDFVLDESLDSFVPVFLLYIDLEDGKDWLPMKLYFYDNLTQLLPNYTEYDVDEP